MNRIGRALGRAAANFMHFATSQAGVVGTGQAVLIELFNVKLEKLPVTRYDDGCCGDVCDASCIVTDTPGEAKEWWGRDGE